MDTLAKADIFFFVTTIAVVFVTIGLLVSFYYVVTAIRRLTDTIEKIERNMKDASEDVKEMAEDVRESFLFSLLFRKKRRTKHN
jgi:hypothetical protein